MKARYWLFFLVSLLLTWAAIAILVWFAVMATARTGKTESVIVAEGEVLAYTDGEGHYYTFQWEDDGDDLVIRVTHIDQEPEVYYLIRIQDNEVTLTLNRDRFGFLE